MEEISNLKKCKMEDIKRIIDFYDLIEDYPKLNYLSNDTMNILKAWFINTLENVNTWFYYHQKSKLEYRKAIQYITFKLKDILLYYNDYTTNYDKLLNDNKNNCNSKINDINLLLNWKETCESHLDNLIEGYNTNYNLKKCDKNIENNYKKNIIPLQNLLDKCDLTCDQYLIIKNEYLSKLNKINTKKKKYKCIYNSLNSILQVSSVILPTLITIKDTQKIENETIKHTLDYTCIGLAVLVGIITNFSGFFKISQKYSLYTQYNNKIRQEIRRFLTLTEKYYKKNHLEAYQLFPKFSNTIEEYIDEMNNLSHELITKKNNEEDEEEKDVDNNKNIKNNEIIDETESDNYDTFHNQHTAKRTNNYDTFHNQHTAKRTNNFDTETNKLKRELRSKELSNFRLNARLIELHKKLNAYEMDEFYKKNNKDKKNNEDDINEDDNNKDDINEDDNNKDDINEDDNNKDDINEDDNENNDINEDDNNKDDINEDDNENNDNITINP